MDTARRQNPDLNFDWIGKLPFERDLAHDIDFYRLFASLRSRHASSFLFESLALPRHQDRYHALGFDPVAVFSARGGILTVEAGDPAIMTKICGVAANRVDLDVGNPYAVLRDSFPDGALGSAHQGGLVGFVCHEAVNYVEPSLALPEHAAFGAFRFGLYLDGLVYDTTTATLKYYSYGERRDEAILALLPSLATDAVESRISQVAYDGQSLSEAEYVAAVADTQKKIAQGYSFQAEVGIRSNFTIRGDKFAIYDRLRQVNPSPYMYYVRFGDLEVMGASPEIMASCKQGIALTTPAAGTIRRGADDEDDARLARTLLNDPKEIAEHNMLVDLHRNDLARVSRPGSVRVQDLMFLIKFSHVQHIMSQITSELAEGRNAFDLLASLLPCGVVTGAPKVETIRIIAENEKTPRGPYGGAVGRFSLNGDCDFCLTIRGMFCAGDACFAQTSAGVVYDSVPAREYAEVTHKLAAMRQVLQDLGGRFE